MSADISQALRAGLALGIPTAKPPDLADGALPIDRLIRAMWGQNWTVMVLAQPVEETVSRDLRRQVINDMRAAQTDVRTAGVPAIWPSTSTPFLKPKCSRSLRRKPWALGERRSIFSETTKAILRWLALGGASSPDLNRCQSRCASGKTPMQQSSRQRGRCPTP